MQYCIVSCYVHCICSAVHCHPLTLYVVSCVTEIDNCVGDPCENGGTCEDGILTYSCTCVLGYEGDDCETSMQLYLI